VADAPTKSGWSCSVKMFGVIGNAPRSEIEEIIKNKEKLATFNASHATQHEHEGLTLYSR